MFKKGSFPSATSWRCVLIVVHYCLKIFKSSFMFYFIPCLYSFSLMSLVNLTVFLNPLFMAAPTPNVTFFAPSFSSSLYSFFYMFVAKFLVPSIVALVKFLNPSLICCLPSFENVFFTN